MDAIDAQKEIVKFLLERLKACALESAALRAAILNLPPMTQAETMKTAQYYRQSSAIQKKVETGFQPLDSLVRQVDEGLNREEAHRLLEQFDPLGRLEN